MFNYCHQYEREGDVDNVVFPCGCTPDSNGAALNPYNVVASRLRRPAFGRYSIGCINTAARTGMGNPGRIDINSGTRSVDCVPLY